MYKIVGEYLIFATPWSVQFKYSWVHGNFIHLVKRVAQVQTRPRTVITMLIGRYIWIYTGHDGDQYLVRFISVTRVSIGGCSVQETSD